MTAISSLRRKSRLCCGEVFNNSMLPAKGGQTGPAPFVDKFFLALIA